MCWFLRLKIGIGVNDLNFGERSNRLQMAVKKMKIRLWPSGTNKWFWELECFVGLSKFVLALKLPLGYVGGNSALMAHRTRADGESCCIFSRLCSPNGILRADFLFLSVQTPVRFSSQNNWVRLRLAASAAAQALCFLTTRWLAEKVRADSPSTLIGCLLSASLCPSLALCLGGVSSQPQLCLLLDYHHWRNGRESHGWQIKRRGEEGAKGVRVRVAVVQTEEWILWVPRGLEVFNERNEVSSDTKLRHKLSLPVCLSLQQVSFARFPPGGGPVRNTSTTSESNHSFLTLGWLCRGMFIFTIFILISVPGTLDLAVVTLKKIKKKNQYPVSSERWKVTCS